MLGSLDDSRLLCPLHSTWLLFVEEVQAFKTLLYSAIRSLKAAYSHIPFPSQQQAPCEFDEAERVPKEL